MTNLSGANLNNGAAVGPQCEGRDSPSNFPKYSAYKDSGVEWLGAVPEGWELIPFKYVAEFVNGMAFKPEQWSEVGIPIIRIENLNNGESFNYFEGTVEERYHVKTGDLLFGWSGNRGTSFGPFLWHGVGLHYLNQHIFRIADFRCDKKWLYWALKAVTKTIEDQAHGIIGMVHVTKGKLGGIKIPLLPHPEQTQIARFLDHETARIDALIEEQQRLIELLKEKRQAVISHAVTKGLDLTVPMKDSGVEWLGEVPAHWEFGKVRYFAKLESGHTPSRGKPEYWENCTVPWFSLADVWQIRKGEVEEVFETKELVSELGLANSSARLLPKGTVILSRTASVGYSAIMGCAMATTQDFANWICGEKLFNYYLLCCFRAMSSEFLKLMMGSTHKTIYMPDIAELVCPVPPLDEQEKIASFIRESSLKFGSLVAEAERMKELLAERRSALISAAVTGKIDVRGWQPPTGTPSPESAIAEAH